MRTKDSPEGEEDLHDISKPIHVCALHRLFLEEVMRHQLNSALSQGIGVFFRPDVVRLFENIRTILDDKIEGGILERELKGETTCTQCQM